METFDRSAKIKAKIFKKILDIHEANPDLRFGQIIRNAAWDDNFDIFVIEDEALLKKLEQFHNSIQRAKMINGITRSKKE